MNTSLRFFCLLAVLALGFYKLQAAPPATNGSAGFQLIADLSDGSRVIGKCGEDALKFRSDVLGEMKLSLERVRSVECQPKTNSVKLTTSSGDTLAVQFAMKEIRVETAFASVKLPVGLIRRLQVLPTGAAGKTRPGLVARWSAENDAKDIIGGNDGVLEAGAGLAVGKIGQAFNLNGVDPDSHPDVGPDVRVPDSPLWNFGTKDFSIELWANFHALPPAGARIGYPYGGVIISNDEGAGGGNKWWFALDGRVLDLHVNGPTINNGRGIFLVQAAFTPDLNVWYHLAVTRCDNLYTIYVNGVAVGSQVDAHAIPDANAPLTIGSAEGFYFNGLLDEVGIYSRALSAAEVQAIYAEGK
jgi:hypothetical protein